LYTKPSAKIFTCNIITTTTNITSMPSVIVTIHITYPQAPEFRWAFTVPAPPPFVNNIHINLNIRLGENQGDLERGMEEGMEERMMEEGLLEGMMEEGMEEEGMGEEGMGEEGMEEVW
jgi:hypothetical protein